MISPEARVAFLRRIHLFHGLKDEDLAAIAGKLDEESRSEGESIFVQGDDADRFFLIHHGAVRMSFPQRGEDYELEILAAGDHFGEEALREGGTRSVSAQAVESAELLSISGPDFDTFIRQFPKLKTAIQVSLESRQLARKLHFDWLGQQEVVYFLARKHQVVLIQTLAVPILALAAPLFLVGHFFLTRAFFAIFGAGVLFVAIAAWAVWNWIDWGNDFYIVTNQRAVWLEKVIGLYDSRQETPLSTVLSVGVETDMTGRLLDYGNVIVRTYVGKIIFSHVAHPYEASHLLEEHWIRTRHLSSRMEKETMRNVLRHKMGLPVEKKTETTPEPDEMVSPSIYKRSLLKLVSDKWFKLRIEDSGTITYRKHWFVLWRQVWQPSILIFLIGLGMLSRLLTLARSPEVGLVHPSRVPPVDTTMLVLPSLLIPILLWWIYQYIDWHNDIFLVTPDQIIDIDKKPFGSEARRAAPLENILSTESERLGLTGYLLNFGTVHITIGGAHLDFQDVLDPTAVQADIDRRREARAASKRETEAASERDRVSDWLVAYHENEAEFRQHPGSAGVEPKKE